MPVKSTRNKYQLPPRPFLYTLDQLLDILRYERLDQLTKSVHFLGRSTGRCPKDKMLAKNIAASSEEPEWRVEEDEFVRWMRVVRIIPASRPLRHA